jgi:hypothetical protein
MKVAMIAKILLQDNLDFRNKKNLAKYLDKEFKGDISSLKKVSKLARDLTEVKDNFKT